MSSNVIQLLRLRRDELAGLEASRENWPQIQAWHASTRPLISKYAKSEIKAFDELVAFPWYLSSLRQHEENKINKERAESYKQRLLSLMDGIIQLQELDVSSVSQDINSQSVTHNPSTKVFVVHGHDKEMKANVARTLTILGLDPVILHERPNKGQTIIEKFENNSDVAFAVILLSPDDTAYSTGSKPNTAKPRARQNVILELGYFAGKLGRNRVFALKHGENLEVPSDLHGVVYTNYDAAGHWELELARELQAAGFKVDANKLISKA